MTAAPVIAPRQQGPSLVTARNLRVMTLTPFYPSIEDPARGCFIAEPLVFTEQIGVRNYAIAAEPFYRSTFRRLDSRIESASQTYFSFPGNLGLPTAGGFLAASIKETAVRLHASQPFDLIHAHAALPCGEAAASLSNSL
jgi:hypothetical protein